MKYKQCIQAGNNVNDILKLPCVTTVRKLDSGRYVYELVLNKKQWLPPIAVEGDWICQDEDGEWTVMSDETHRFLTSM